MTKRIISFILLFVLLVSLFSCEEEKLKETTGQNTDISDFTSVEESTDKSSSSVEVSEEESSTEAESEDVKGDKGFYVMFIDVGQADASLIMCDGRYMLIDGGNVADSNRIYSVLKARGVEHLDYVIGTHAHEDHIGGIAAAFSACTVGKVFSPVTSAESVPFNHFKTAAERQGLKLEMPNLDKEYYLGSGRFSVLAPRADYESVNNSSIVVRFEYGDNVFLFTADAERESEQAMINADCNLSADLLKVGHHGSYSSTSYLFLREVMPTYAVISVGANNDYGHPHKEVLDRLENADVQIMRTDKLGDIICYSDGQNLRFENGTADENLSFAYVGNKNSMLLHTVDCGGLPKEENRVYFVNLEDAERGGYTKHCGNCMHD